MTFCNVVLLLFTVIAVCFGRGCYYLVDKLAAKNYTHVTEIKLEYIYYPRQLNPYILRTWHHAALILLNLRAIHLKAKKMESLI